MILLGKNKIIKGIAAVLLITVLLTLLFTACSKKVDREASEDIPETYELTHGKSLKIGDYVQLGNYQVEDEGYNPILWIVIDNSSHYSGYVNPEVEHITLLSACIIDLRGFDAIEPENANELRRGYGNGRYRTSNIRQWLSSSGGENSWWAAQNLDDGEIGTNNADKPPSDDLAFCPKSGGVIVYNTDPFSNEARGYAVSCKDWKELDQVANCIFETIADEDTVIFSKYVPGGSGESSDIIVEEGGYLSLNLKWERHLSDEFSTCYRNTVLATVWSRY